MHNKDDLIAGHCEVYLLCWSVLKFIVTEKVFNEANKAIINNKNNKDKKSRGGQSAIRSAKHNFHNFHNCRSCVAL